MRSSSWTLILPLLVLSTVGCVPNEYYVDTPPPPPQEEYIGAPPYPGAVYVNGYWAWEGNRHVWRRGYWDRGRPGRVYYPNRWEQRGNRYVFRRGGWHRR